MHHPVEYYPPAAQDRGDDGAWSPLRQPIYRALWIAAVCSNMGSWMHDMAAGWLMATITTSPLTISLVQTAFLAPVFLFAIPAGAFADVLDRRRVVIVAQWWMMLMAALLAVLTWRGAVDAWSVLLLSFLLAVGTAVATPAWFAVIPEMVLPRRVPQAITLNSIAFNGSRALGPALGGLVVGAWGPAGAFFCNALSFLAVIVVLQRWHPRRTAPRSPTGVVAAMKEGLRGALRSAEARSLLVRACLFGVLGAALWGLLPTLGPLVLKLSPNAYGRLLACIGVGVVSAAGFLNRLQRALERDVLIALASGVLGGAALVVAWSASLPPLYGALVVAGAAWVSLNSTFIAGIQFVTAGAVRARVMGVYLVVLLGGSAAGSALFGYLATLIEADRSLAEGTRGALAVAGVALIVVAAAEALFRGGGQLAASVEPGSAG
jgi:MFS family permease